MQSQVVDVNEARVQGDDGYSSVGVDDNLQLPMCQPLPPPSSTD